MAKGFIKETGLKEWLHKRLRGRYLEGFSEGNKELKGLAFEGKAANGDENWECQGFLKVEWLKR